MEVPLEPTQVMEVKARAVMQVAIDRGSFLGELTVMAGAGMSCSLSPWQHIEA